MDMIMAAERIEDSDYILFVFTVEAPFRRKGKIIAEIGQERLRPDVIEVVDDEVVEGGGNHDGRTMEGVLGVLLHFLKSEINIQHEAAQERQKGYGEEGEKQFLLQQEFLHGFFTFMFAVV